MFFVLSRIFSYVASPWLYILAALTAAIFLKKKKAKIYAASAAAFLFLIFTNAPLYYAAEKSWVSDISSPIQPDKTYTYGVVEGGYSEYDSIRNRLEFYEAADRLIDAVMLYRKGVIRKIIISGDGSIVDNGGNKDIVLEYLTAWGVRQGDIVFEPEARNTKEHPSAILKLLGEQIKAEPILVITSAIHMKRSLYVFEEAGFKADGYAVDSTILHGRKWTEWLPDINLPAKWYWLLHEWIGNMVYRIA